ncbi:UNVERIFIED_CONTAM: hypothetical protein RMT77_002330 [Armadillidium vulgare]
MKLFKKIILKRKKRKEECLINSSRNAEEMIQKEEIQKTRWNFSINKSSTSSNEDIKKEKIHECLLNNNKFTQHPIPPLPSAPTLRLLTTSNIDHESRDNILNSIYAQVYHHQHQYKNPETDYKYISEEDLREYDSRPTFNRKYAPN